MARHRHRTNPFYVLLVAIGIAFTVTACAYFVMALRGSSSGGVGRAVALASEAESPLALIAFLDRHGVKLLVAELGLLALATCGAIGTDGWWSSGHRAPAAGQNPDDTLPHR